MNKQLTHSSFTFTLHLASAAGLLVALAGSAAQAQVTPLTAPPAGYAATTTAAYPLNNNNGGFIDAPFTVAAGGVNVTYTAASPGLHLFETFDNADGALDFPKNTNLIDTFDTKNPTGPFLITFSSGVSSFGLNADSSAADVATFSYTAYNNGNVIGQFTYAPVTQAVGSPHSIFIGAMVTGGPLITSIQISDTSIATNSMGSDTFATNDFYIGPLSTFAPVPESSTTVSFGLLLALGVGGAIFSARKKTAVAKASAA